jgi:hypothetical protein
LKYTKHIIFTLLSLVVIDSFRWISYTGLLNFGFFTYISIFLIYLSIYFLIKIAISSNWKKFTPVNIQNSIKLWIGINGINFVRGLFLAKDYWDYKFLFFSALSFTLVCLAFFVGNNMQRSLIVFKFVLKYLFPFGFLLIPLAIATNLELYSRIMISISLFILFIPFLRFRYKVLIVLVAVISILLVIGFRSNIIKISFSLLLLLVYYLNMNKRWLRIFNFSLFAMPIIMFLLAVSGTFNVFEDISNSKKLQVTTDQSSGETLGGDSRTFLYVEVLNSINKRGNFLIGSGMSAGYDSVLIDVSNGTYNNKRYECEVGMLNVLMQSGLIGVLIYFLVVLKVSFLAINHSSNRLAKILGLYISFRWLFSFVEEFTQYDMNFYFFWLTVGLVSSNEFRNMNDKEIKNWIRSIFANSKKFIKSKYSHTVLRP